MKPTPLDTETPFGELRPRLRQRLGWNLATAPWPPRIKRWLRRRVRGEAGPFDVSVLPPGLGQDETEPVAWRTGKLRTARLHFRAYPSENYCDRVLVGRERLPEAREHLEILHFNALRPIGSFVDVGANVGTYSVFVGTIAPEARIVAFEPHPLTAEKLRFNLFANAVEAEVVEAAVGAESGRMELWSDGGGNIGQTSLLPQATSNAKLSVAVDVVPLAETLAAHGLDRIDLMKIDVEGFEDRALAPYLTSDAPLPGALLLEEEHAGLWETDLRALLADLDYRVTFRTDQNALYVRSA